MAISKNGAASAADMSFQSEVGVLYSAHHNWLYNWLRGKLGNTGDAADIAHDTFVRVMAGQKKQLLSGDTPRAFLTHIAKGLVVDHWRRRDIELAFLNSIAHFPESEVPSPETRVLILEALMRIDAMLMSMPAQTRKIFFLAQLDGLRYQDIATQLNVSLITVKRHMRTAFIACLTLD
jgi:RNA polymerase sigma factor (sigma-70 family)